MFRRWVCRWWGHKWEAGLCLRCWMRAPNQRFLWETGAIRPGYRDD